MLTLTLGLTLDLVLGLGLELGLGLAYASLTSVLILTLVFSPSHLGSWPRQISQEMEHEWIIVNFSVNGNYSYVRFISLLLISFNEIMRIHWVKVVAAVAVNYLYLVQDS